MPTRSSIAVTAGSGTNMATSSYSDGGTKHDEVVVLGEQHLATYRFRTGGISTTTVDSHILQVMAGSSLHAYIRHIRVYQFVAATTAAFMLWDVVRLSTAGTGGGAVTPAPLDTGDSAYSGAGATLPSSKGTESATIDSQASYFTQTPGAGGMPTNTLVADFTFGSFRSKGLRIPSGTANGIAIKNRTAISAGQVIVSIEVCEAPY